MAKKAAKKTAKKAPAKKAAKKTATKKVAKKAAKKVAKKAAKKTTKKAAKKASAVQAVFAPSYEDIKQAAYYIYLERVSKGTPGNDKSDWSAAEKALCI